MKKYRIIIVLIISISALTVTSTMSANEVTLTSLPTALAALDNSNLSIGIQQKTANAAQFNSEITKSRMKPQIDSTFGVFFTRDLTENSADQFDPSINSRNLSGGLTATQVLFNFGTLRAEYSRDKLSAKAELKQVEVVRNQQALQTVIMYVNLALALDVLAARNENERLLNLQKEGVSSRFEIGVASATEVARIEARIFANDAEKKALEEAIEIFRNNLKVLTGIRIIRAELPNQVLLPSLTFEEYKKAALQDNSEIQFAQLTLKSTMEELRVQKKQKLPIIVGQSSLSASKINSTSAQNIDSLTAQLGLQVIVPIYQGGQLKAQVKQAKELEGADKLRLALSQREVLADVTETWLQVKNTKDRLGIRQNQLNQSEFAFNGIVEEQRLGRRTSFELLEAESDLLGAKISLQEAKRDYVAASAELLTLINKLTSEMFT